ncbi:MULTISPECIES: extracellular solute-binding protein [Paenibacillus]|uniref:extracellular solute-binding protein n=1 Tax=Paenibacillus TaxID=44249 RepID=UPI0022B8738B|nr:extracellular solute-binding protein [Paenibacillus caseinilyticus]MCZ8519827.1 extracellular solute-binding protein [Paenibacillus caseinilyticus]
MHRSLRPSLLLCSLLLLATSACSPQEQEPAMPAPQETKPSLIQFVAAEYSSASKPLLENLVREFELKNPSIDVELQVVNWDILDGVYTTMISGGQPPDLLSTNIYAHFAESGRLHNLNDILSPELKGKFYDHFMEIDRRHGVQYAIPYVASVRNLYYNKELFEQAGIAAPPATWSDLQLAARKIKSAGRAYGFGVDLTDNEIQAYLSYFFNGAGGGWMRDGQWTINSPENVEGLAFLKELYDQGLTDPEPAVTTRDEKQRILGDGRLGMMISGNYFSSVVPTEFPGLKWGVGPIPVKDGLPPAAFGVQDVLVSFQTDHADPKAISRFLDFLYDDANYERLVAAEGVLPVTRTVGDRLSRLDPLTREHIDQLQQARFYPIDQPVWSAVMAASRKMGEAVLQGHVSPRQALDQLQLFAVSQTRP